MQLGQHGQHGGLAPRPVLTTETWFLELKEEPESVSLEKTEESAVQILVETLDRTSPAA